MSKCLSVVALVLLVLSGAIGLKNVVAANAATVSASNSYTVSIWSNGPGPIPPRANGPGPIPPRSNGPGPIPPRGNGPGPIPPRAFAVNGHVVANGPGPIPPRVSR